MPRRRTLATGILPYALSMLPSLRHRGFACRRAQLPGHGQPLASSFPVAQVVNLCLFASLRLDPVAPVFNLCLFVSLCRSPVAQVFNLCLFVLLRFSPVAQVFNLCLPPPPHSGLPDNPAAQKTPERQRGD